MSRDYAGLAAQIAANADDEVLCLRIIRRAVQSLGHLKNPSDISAFHQNPATTGLPTWDALLAGLAAHTWSLAGHTDPLPWTQTVEPLPEWWEPGGMPLRWRFWNLVHTPPSIQAKRAILPRQWLEAV